MSTKRGSEQTQHIVYAYNSSYSEAEAEGSLEVTISRPAWAT
jgi:hypothetical protein